MIWISKRAEKDIREMKMALEGAMPTIQNASTGVDEIKQALSSLAMAEAKGEDETRVATPEEELGVLILACIAKAGKWNHLHLHATLDELPKDDLEQNIRGLRLLARAHVGLGSKRPSSGDTSGQRAYAFYKKVLDSSPTGEVVELRGDPRASGAA